MGLEEKLGYVMLGYEKASTALIHLDYKSEVIQKLVEQIYQLQCGDPIVQFDNADSRRYFAEKQSEMMTERQEDYHEMFRDEEIAYLLNALNFFGNKQYLLQRQHMPM